MEVTGYRKPTHLRDDGLWREGEYALEELLASHSTYVWEKTGERAGVGGRGWKIKNKWIVSEKHWVHIISRTSVTTKYRYRSDVYYITQRRFLISKLGIAMRTKILLGYSLNASKICYVRYRNCNAQSFFFWINMAATPEKLLKSAFFHTFLEITDLSRISSFIIIFIFVLQRWQF